MKATGIVRRIDDLGRVVIPKEIRRTMRIREGDPLEIFTDREGEVIFKKYSPMGELSVLAGACCEAVSKSTEKGIIICDRERCIAAAGIPKKEVLERRITNCIEEIANNRKTYILTDKQEKIAALDGTEYITSAAVPILSSGDLTGIIILVCEKNSDPFPSESDIKLAQTTALFLGKNLEE